MIGIATDHAGVTLKNALLAHLKDHWSMIDYGTDQNDPVDYPDYAKRLCTELINGVINKGILICGSGIGMSMAANRFSEIRAALCFSPDMAQLAREHNNANILVLGARFVTIDQATRCADIFLSTEFMHGRHSTRLLKFSKNID